MAGIATVAAPGLAADSVQVKAERPPFEAMTPPPAPDYRDEASWAALPWRTDAADTVPPGGWPIDRLTVAKVDVFFVHPTTDLRRDRWNAPIDDAATNDWTDRSVIARQASIFNAAGRVFAPRYRQGSSGSGMPGAADGGPAFAIAYQDVRAAFRHYLDHWNTGRPFILAGHSQGSFMVARLLEDVAADPALRNRLVAAYAVGLGLTVGEAAVRFPGIPVCRTSTQTGCVAAWNSYLDGGDAAGYASAARSFAVKAQGRVGESDLACTNPLTFTASRPSATASRNLGALSGEPGKSVIGRLIPRATGARCEGGVLIVDQGAADALGVRSLGGGSMHFHDYAIFYESIRRNALVRSQAWLQRHSG